MSNRSDAELIDDIREAIRRISSYLGNCSYEAFRDDTKTQDAVIRNIEIIGEAAKGVSEALRVKTPHLPWKSMAGMRDRLIHDYFGVNLDIVWHVNTSTGFRIRQAGSKRQFRISECLSWRITTARFATGRGAIARAGVSVS